MEKVHTCALSGLPEWNLASRLPYIIWGFHHVAGFRRRHIGASIHHAWTHSLGEVRGALDADSRLSIAPYSCELLPRSSVRHARR